VISAICRARVIVCRLFLFLKWILSVEISVRIMFFGPKYRFAVQRFKVSRCPVNLLVMRRAPFAMTFNFPSSSLYKKTSLSLSEKFLCPSIMHFNVAVFIILRLVICLSIHVLRPLN